MRLLCRLTVCLLLVPLITGATSFRSGRSQTALLELFTSEGCSSCPPADQWLSGLLNHPGLWVHVVPVAFHVDYWNYLGWKDRFAQSEFSSRQRRYHREGSLSGVYTPGVLRSGEELRDWRGAAPDLGSGGTAPGVLELILDGDHFEANFTARTTDTEDQLVLNVAILGIGLRNPVKSGENSGRVLNHDFVVLGYKSYGSKKAEWQGRLPVTHFSGDARSLAVAAWVSPGNSLKPLQAVGGWMPRH